MLLVACPNMPTLLNDAHPYDFNENKFKLFRNTIAMFERGTNTITCKSNVMIAA